MKRYIKDRIRSLLQLNDPPHKLALAFALGVFVAFSPTIGLHTLSCLLLAWLFRVSKVVVFTASLVNNPWTMVPIFGFCLWFGIKVTGSDIPTPAIAWKELGMGDIFTILKPFLWSFVVGTVIIGAVAALLSYFLFYWVVVKYRSSRSTVK